MTAGCDSIFVLLMFGGYSGVGDGVGKQKPTATASRGFLSKTVQARQATVASSPTRTTTTATDMSARGAFLLIVAETLKSLPTRVKPGFSPDRGAVPVLAGAHDPGRNAAGSFKCRR